LPAEGDCDACARIEIIEEHIDLLDGEDILLQTQIDNLQTDLTEVTNNLNEFFASSGNIHYQVTTWSNSDLKSGTFVQITPGSSAFKIPAFIYLRMVYGGTNVFTTSPVVKIYWANPGSSAVFQSLNTDSQFWQADKNAMHVTAISGNQNGDEITFHDTNNAIIAGLSTNQTGNAANNNYVLVHFWWYEV